MNDKMGMREKVLIQLRGPDGELKVDRHIETETEENTDEKVKQPKNP